MKKKEKKKAKPGRLRIRVVLTAGAASLLGAACNSTSNSVVAPSVMENPCEGCVTNPDGGHDAGVDAGLDAGEDGGNDGGADGGDGG